MNLSERKLRRLGRRHYDDPAHGIVGCLIGATALIQCDAMPRIMAHALGVVAVLAVSASTLRSRLDAVLQHDRVETDSLGKAHRYDGDDLHHGGDEFWPLMQQAVAAVGRCQDI